jgi:hypothetical protein
MPDANADSESHAPEELDDLSKQIKAFELYTSKKSKGMLTLSLVGPYPHSARVSAHVYWDGDRSEDTGMIT